MAIVLDANTNLGSAFATSLTTSHTCSGVNRILFVGGWGDTASDNWTGVTYNGVPMTRVSSVRYGGTDRYDYVYALLNPATGANNVVISANNSGGISANATSFTGASQDIPIGSLPFITGSGVSQASASLAITTAFNNSNAYGLMHGMETAGANTTKNSGNNAQAGYLRTTNLATAGTLTLAWTNSATDWGAIVVGIYPPQPTNTGAFFPFF